MKGPKQLKGEPRAAHGWRKVGFGGSAFFTTKSTKDTKFRTCRTDWRDWPANNCAAWRRALLMLLAL